MMMLLGSGRGDGLQPTRQFLAREDARLDAHFRGVLRRLRERPPRGLSPAQRAARAVHLERLEGYRRRGVFPRNERFARRTLPHFIDDHGTRCAMGHLIEESGERELVQDVARNRNYDRIRRLADIPALVAWLEANGLTLAEAALIQPAYCGSAASLCVCGPAYMGMVEGTVALAGLKVTAIYDATIPNLAVGDTVRIVDSHSLAVPNGIVFATVYGEGTERAAMPLFAASQGQVVVKSELCMFGTMVPISPVGPIPVATFREAMIHDHCDATLKALDPAWSVVKGVCDTSPPVPTGGAPNSGGATNSGGVSASHDGGAYDSGAGGAGGNPSASGGTRTGGFTSTQPVNTGGFAAGYNDYVTGGAPPTAPTAVPSQPASSISNEGTDDGSCGLVLHGPHPHALALVVSAACIAHGIRRLRRPS